MSIEVKTGIEDPLGWMMDDYGNWDIIYDYSDKDRYGRLDMIYRCLVDGIFNNELLGKTKKQLMAEYETKFPILLAEVFENIAKDIRDGGLVIKTCFER